MLARQVWCSRLQYWARFSPRWGPSGRRSTGCVQQKTRVWQLKDAKLKTRNEYQAIEAAEEEFDLSDLKWLYVAKEASEGGKKGSKRKIYDSCSEGDGTDLSPESWFLNRGAKVMPKFSVIWSAYWCSSLNSWCRALMVDGWWLLICCLLWIPCFPVSTLLFLNPHTMCQEGGGELIHNINQKVVVGWVVVVL